MTERDREVAIQTVKAILHVLHEKNMRICHPVWTRWNGTMQREYGNVFRALHGFFSRLHCLSDDKD